ncbi:hypothetical protein A8B78_11780 [Jannaschia sp. EhC01]|nr:hypothetical protein A8B78_11780 [Jannaschia sp. EhC01]
MKDTPADRPFGDRTSNDATRTAPEDLTTLLRMRAQVDGAKAAVQFLTDDVGNMETLSYADLWNRSRAAASALITAAPAGGSVLLALPTSPELVTAFLGAVMAGLRPAILPPPRRGSGRRGAATHRLLHLAAQRRTVLLCTTPDGHDTLIGAGLQENAATRLLSLPPGFDRPGAHPWVPPAASAQDIACLQFTSGSTQHPRGVVLSHGNILANMDDIRTAFGSGPASRALGWLPLHHDMGLFGHLIHPLFIGGTAVLATPEWFTRAPLDWLHAITALEITDTGAPPFAWHLLTRALSETDIPGLDLGSLNVAHVGAETVHPGPLCRALTELTRFGMRQDGFLPCYGMAEATVFAAAGRFPGTHGAAVRYSPGASMTVRIADPEIGAELPSGETGEIWLAGASLAHRYDNGTDTGVAETDGRHWLRTGDLGRMGSHGLGVYGRRDNRIMYRGATHHAEDLEATLRATVPGLAAASMAAVPFAGKEGEGLAIVTEARAPGDAAQDLRVGITSALADTHEITPGTVVFVRPGSLPRTTSGKLRRAEICALLKSGALERRAATAKPPKARPAATSMTDAPPASETARVAIVGMACRFPGADDPDTFWERLLAGDNLITDIPTDRWDVDEYFADDPATPGRMNTRRGGFIDGAALFDARFFGLSDPEAAEMDPQQRLALEVSWRALEHAGMTREKLRGSNTGVFLGISTTDYAHLQIRARPDLAAFSAWSGLGTAQSIAANRISFAHDLRGPSMAIDTACSSSLTAVHMAAGALLRGDCDAALAGGVNLMLSPGTTVALAQFGMLASDGACKVFDERADGYVRSEGCGFVLLKRLDSARADGDRILGVIRATTAAQDGHSAGITAPNPEAQEALITQALARAQIAPAQVRFVEAHGTGTSIGDPVELDVLHRTYGACPGAICQVGSVKASAGHLEAAAGVASLIKTVQVLRHRMVPPQIHFHDLPPGIDLGNSRLRIPVAPEPLRPTGGQPLCAAVNSFGFGGALAHVIVEEAPQSSPDTPRTTLLASGPLSPDDEPLWLLPVSAQSDQAFAVLTRDLARFVNAQPPGPLAPLACMLSRRRSHFARRGFVISNDLPGAAKALESDLAEAPNADYRALTEPRVGFLFTGQGAHMAGHGKGLVRRFKVFAAALDDAAEALARLDPKVPRLHDILFGDGTLLQRTDLAQPALIAMSHALDRLWRSFGVTPAAVTGHSLGEIAACLASGALDLDGAMALALRRGRLMAGLEYPGAMAAVALSAEALEERLDVWRLPGLAVAAVNGATASSLAGPKDSLVRALEHLSRDRIAARRLATPVAFHSAVLDPILGALEADASAIPSSTPGVPTVSTLTGAPMSDAPTAAHWRRHAREPVRFAQALGAMAEAGCTHLIEIGPGQVLTGLARAALPSTTALPSLPHGPGDARKDQAGILNAVGTLFNDGAELDWSGLEAPSDAPNWLEGVPGHPFEWRRYWFDMDLSRPETPTDLPTHSTLTWPGWHPPKDSAGSDRPITSDEDRNWLIVGDGSGMAGALATELCGRGRRVFHLTRSARGKPWSVSRGDHKGLRRIAMPDLPEPEPMAKALIDLLSRRVPGTATRWSVLVPGPLDMGPTASPKDTEAHQRRDGIGLLTTLIQALRISGLTGQMHVLTRGAVQTTPDFSPDPAQAALWGFGATLFLEHPDLRGGILDIDAEDDVAVLLDALDQPGLPGMAALRAGYVLAPELTPARGSDTTLPDLDAQGTYLVTGGLGGLGLETAVWLAQRGAGHIVLMSRSADVAARTSHAERIARIDAAGADVTLITCDTADEIALRNHIRALKAAPRPLRGVVHAAGQNWLGRIADQPPDRVLETMRIKAGAALVLHEETREIPLDLFVMYSSVSALWGSVELAHYAAANRFCDALAEMRQAQGLPATSINWGPWAKVGMSAHPRETEIVTALGLPLMAPQDALQALEQALATPDAVKILARFDWRRFTAFADYSLWPDLFAPLRRASETERSVQKSGQHLSAELRGLTETQARERLSAAIRRELAALVYLPPGREISPDEPFNLLGIDSLTAIGFALRLENQTGVTMPPTLAYTHPTITDVTDYVLSHLRNVPTAEPKASPIPARPTTGASMICMPYAGASTAVFSDWRVPCVVLRPAELPGRGTRHEEAEMPDLAELAANMAREIVASGAAEVLYGHSFGARLAFETARLLAPGVAPRLLILSCLGPEPPAPDGDILDGADADLVARLARDWHGNAPGSPAWDSLLPGLRHDLSLLARAGPVDGPPLDIPILVVGGREDELAPPQSLIQWETHTTGAFTVTLLPGGHMPFRHVPKAYFETLTSAIGDLNLPEQKGSAL